MSLAACPRFRGKITSLPVAFGGIINLITRKPADSFQQSLRLDGTFQTESFSESGDYGPSYSIANRFGNADVLASIALRDSGIAYDANGDVIGSDNTQGDTMDSELVSQFSDSWLLADPAILAEPDGAQPPGSPG